MEPLPIIKYPDPVLIRATEEITEITDDTVSLVKGMFEAMYRVRGLGMAAPQVGKGLRITVINLTDKEDQEHVLINPHILEMEGEEVGEEGCLSFPGLTVKLKRAAWVKVRAVDLDGNEFEAEADGLMARAVQHEIDHLDGELFLGKFSMAQKLHAASKLKEFEQQYRARQ